MRTAGLEPAWAYAREIFIPTTTFVAANWRLWSGLSLHRSVLALGAARLVSTPSHCLGLARDCHRHDPEGFPEFEQFYFRCFQRSTQFQSSLLCIPVPPRPLIVRRKNKVLNRICLDNHLFRQICMRNEQCLLVLLSSCYAFLLLFYIDTSASKFQKLLEVRTPKLPPQTPIHPFQLMVLLPTCS